MPIETETTCCILWAMKNARVQEKPIFSFSKSWRHTSLYPHITTYSWDQVLNCSAERASVASNIQLSAWMLVLHVICMYMYAYIHHACLWRTPTSLRNSCNCWQSTPREIAYPSLLTQHPSRHHGNECHCFPRGCAHYIQKTPQYYIILGVEEMITLK